MQAQKQQLFARIFYILYALMGILAAVYYLVQGDAFFALAAVGTLLLFPAQLVARRFLRGGNYDQVELVVSIFLFLSYTLGVPYAFYRIVPYYDKIMHTLSGTLTMALAFPLFYALKDGHKIERTDKPLAIVFCLMTTIAVAGIWEMVEFPIGTITGIDNQRVLTTGIADTMQDMMVCTLGALLLVPSFGAFYEKNRRGLIMGALSDFVTSRSARHTTGGGKSR